jgi:hypothetical protein
MTFPSRSHLYDRDPSLKYFARLDLMVHALRTQEDKRELVETEMAQMFHRYGRWLCRHRAEIPNNDPDRLDLADFIVILRGLNQRKRDIEAEHS